MSPRFFIHDYSGHPFQVELSSELARRGHEVMHSYCEAHVSGKGNLGDPGSSVQFLPMGAGEVVDKLDFKRRLVQELRFGMQLVRQISASRADVVMIGNAPVPMMLVTTFYLTVRRVPWVLWQQDIQGIAMKSFAGEKLGRAFKIVAFLAARGERWVARKASAIVVIAEAFMDVHRKWGTASKTTVIPNWAPLDELIPVARDNGWARQHGLHAVPNLVYSGTLGLKHRPALLVGLANAVRQAGVPVHLTVVSEGPAVDVLRNEAQRREVPITILPFQPYDRLPEVLGSGDVLVVLLDRSAGAFSVPSKTLSYLCAGRPVLGLMPEENLAAQLIAEAEGCVLPPDETAFAEAARWVTDVLKDDVRRDKIGRQGRALAEREFALGDCATRFQKILVNACTDRRSRRDPSIS